MQRPPVPTDLAALELVPEGVLLVDHAGTILWISTRARSLLGLKPDAVGRAVDDLVVLHSEAGDPCPVAGLLAAKGSRISERLLEVQLGEGRHRAVALSGSHLEGASLLTLRHAGRRRQLDLARSDLVATVSHEIRSPLTSVKGFTKTLLRKFDRFSDEQKRAMLETIDADADRVTRLLTELLDVSRIDAGRVELRRSGVDLAAVVVGVVERARVGPEAEGRQITADVEEVGKALLDGDKVEQVLHNLVENALNYGTGTITVAVRGDEHAVLAQVSDEGPGIAADQSSSIFEKFGRGREVRRAGTGLGLYISRGLVRAHGGDLTLDSELGRGSTFTATWPR